MAEEYFRKVESQVGFALPELYLRMERDGVLHHGKDREDWLKNSHRGNWETRFRLIKPPALSCALGGRSVYWDPPAEVARWVPPDYWKDSIVASFASNGYGDYWCWYPEFADSQGIPVIYCPHDYIEAEIFAPNFEAFLYRAILESWIGITEDALGQFDGGKADYKRFIKANVCTLEPYLNPLWVETLKRISERELTEHEYKYESLYSLLERDEADALLKESVFTGRVGESFRAVQG
jgi:hypothetical protein